MVPLTELRMEERIMACRLEYYNVEKLPNQSLSVIQCGKTVCQAGHSPGQRFYSAYSGTFILRGKGTYLVGGKQHELKAGEGFIITPGMSANYIADRQEPWEYIYAIFRGADAETLVRNAGLDTKHLTFSFSADEEMLGLLSNMHAASRDNKAQGYDVIGYFLLIMSRLIREQTRKGSEPLRPENYIAKAIAYVEDYYPYGVSVRDMAAYVGIDRTHLYRLFMANVGISPQRYLNEYRLKKAVEMMERQQYSLGAIALSVGFYDVSHFSRAFVAHYGIQPGAYREQLHQNMEESE